jgi:hypothetical protein
MDAFSVGKSVDEVQIDNAMSVLQKAGYMVARTAEEAKEIAIDCGYKVSDPVVVNDRVVNLRDLRNYFYMRLWNKYPNRQSYHLEGNIKNEMRAFKLFVESREETGLNRFNAIQECVKIIDTIFDHADKFRFNKPIDLRVLGQGKAGWITHKAILIMNDERKKRQEKEIKEMMDKHEEEFEVDLAEKANELDMLLSRMEANNG